MKLKKLMGVVLTLSLAVTALIGCGNDDEESTKSVDSFRSSIEAGSAISQYTSDTQVKVTAKGDLSQLGMDNELMDIFGFTNDRLDASFSVNTKYVSEKENSSTLGYSFGKLGGDVIGLVVVDGVSYLDVKMLKNSIFDIAGKFVDIDDVKTEINAIIPEGDYIELTQDMLDEIVNLTDLAMVNSVSTENTKEMTEFVEFIGKELDKAAKKSEEDIYSSNGDCYTLTINNSNIDALISALADVVSSDSDKIIDKFNAAFGDMGLTSAQISQVATLLKTTKVSELLDGEIDFELAISTEVKDNTWNLGFDFSISQGNEYIEVSITHKRVEDKKLKIEKPSSIIPKEEVQNLIDELDGLGDILDDDDDDANNGGNSNNGGSTSIEERFEISDNVKTTVANAGTHGMSKDINVPQIYFNGKLYSIGKTTASEFLANGYTIDTEYSDEFDANKKEAPYGEGEMYILYVKELEELSVGIANLGDKEKALKDSELSFFDFDTYSDDVVELYLVGDITIGSTAQDVIKVLGNPTSAYDGTSLYMLTWAFDDGDYIVEYTLTFDSTSDELEGVSLERYKFSF